MFLAPSSAVHDERTGVSYGEIREMAIDSVRAGGEGTAGVEFAVTLSAYGRRNNLHRLEQDVLLDAMRESRCSVLPGNAQMCFSAR